MGMNEQCESCIHNSVCAYKEHYEDVMKLYEKARAECSEYPWFKCKIECTQYRRECYDAIDVAYRNHVEVSEDRADNQKL